MIGNALWPPVIGNALWPPALHFTTSLDAFYRKRDDEIFSRSIRRNQAIIKQLEKHLATRFYRVLSETSSSLVRLVYTVALVVLFPLGLLYWKGKQETGQVVALSRQVEKTKKIWDERSQYLRKLSTKSEKINSITSVIYDLSGGKEAYDQLPKEPSEQHPFYQVCREGIKGVGIRCLNQADQKCLFMELFVEEKTPMRYSSFSSYFHSRHFVTVHDATYDTWSIPSSYLEEKEVVDDPEGWLRQFFLLTRYGNTGKMLDDQEMHMITPSEYQAPSVVFPTVKKYWP